ncbi:MAG: SAM-dependent methyltransferase, partial [Acidimicrobiales bacterium]
VGAGPGSLARSVLAARPRCGPALRYVLVEPSAAQRAQPAAHLPLAPAGAALAPAPAGPSVVSVAEPPDELDAAVVLANELLDNLPFGLLERGPEGWNEVRVGLEGGSLTEVLVPAEIEPVGSAATGAPVGARVPTQRAAAEWVGRARSLAAPAGRVLVFDYASSTAEMAARPWRGWARPYRHHAPGGHPLVQVGQQDVTCEVAVDQLPTPSADWSQADWLRAHGIDDLVAEGRATWQRRAAVGDLEAVRGRSRVIEAEALLDADGLGASRVLEWRP